MLSEKILRFLRDDSNHAEAAKYESTSLQWSNTADSVAEASSHETPAVFSRNPPAEPASNSPWRPAVTSMTSLRKRSSAPNSRTVKFSPNPLTRRALQVPNRDCKQMNRRLPSSSSRSEMPRVWFHKNEENLDASETVFQHASMTAKSYEEGKAHFRVTLGDVLSAAEVFMGASAQSVDPTLNWSYFLPDAFITDVRAEAPSRRRENSTLDDSFYDPRLHLYDFHRVNALRGGVKLDLQHLPATRNALLACWEEAGVSVDKMTTALRGFAIPFGTNELSNHSEALLGDGGALLETNIPRRLSYSLGTLHLQELVNAVVLAPLSELGQLRKKMSISLRTLNPKRVEKLLATVLTPKKSMIKNSEDMERQFSFFNLLTERILNGIDKWSNAKNWMMKNQLATSRFKTVYLLRMFQELIQLQGTRLYPARRPMQCQLESLERNTTYAEVELAKSAEDRSSVAFRATLKAAGFTSEIACDGDLVEDRRGYDHSFLFAIRERIQRFEGLNESAPTENVKRRSRRSKTKFHCESIGKVGSVDCTTYMSAWHKFAGPVGYSMINDTDVYSGTPGKDDFNWVYCAIVNNYEIIRSIKSHKEKMEYKGPSISSLDMVANQARSTVFAHVQDIMKQELMMFERRDALLAERYKLSRDVMMLKIRKAMLAKHERAMRFARKLQIHKQRRIVKAETWRECIDRWVNNSLNPIQNEEADDNPDLTVVRLRRKFVEKETQAGVYPVIIEELQYPEQKRFLLKSLSRYGRFLVRCMDPWKNQRELMDRIDGKSERMAGNIEQMKEAIREMETQHDEMCQILSRDIENLLSLPATHREEKILAEVVQQKRQFLIAENIHYGKLYESLKCFSEAWSSLGSLSEDPRAVYQRKKDEEARLNAARLAEEREIAKEEARIAAQEAMEFQRIMYGTASDQEMLLGDAESVEGSAIPSHSQEARARDLAMPPDLQVNDMSDTAIDGTDAQQAVVDGVDSKEDDAASNASSECLLPTSCSMFYESGNLDTIWSMMNRLVVASKACMQAQVVRLEYATQEQQVLDLVQKARNKRLRQFWKSAMDEYDLKCEERHLEIQAEVSKLKMKQKDMEDEKIRPLELQKQTIISAIKAAEIDMIAVQQNCVNEGLLTEQLRLSVIQFKEVNREPLLFLEAYQQILSDISDAEKLSHKYELDTFALIEAREHVHQKRKDQLNRLHNLVWWTSGWFFNISMKIAEKYCPPKFAKTLWDDFNAAKLPSHEIPADKVARRDTYDWVIDMIENKRWRGLADACPYSAGDIFNDVNVPLSVFHREAEHIHAAKVAALRDDVENLTKVEHEDSLDFLKAQIVGSANFFQKGPSDDTSHLSSTTPSPSAFPPEAGVLIQASWLEGDEVDKDAIASSAKSALQDALPTAKIVSVEPLGGMPHKSGRVSPIEPTGNDGSGKAVRTTEWKMIIKINLRALEKDTIMEKGWRFTILEKGVKVPVALVGNQKSFHEQWKSMNREVEETKMKIFIEKREMKKKTKWIRNLGLSMKGELPTAQMATFYRVIGVPDHIANPIFEEQNNVHLTDQKFLKLEIEKLNKMVAFWTTRVAASDHCTSRTEFDDDDEVISEEKGEEGAMLKKMKKASERAVALKKMQEKLEIRRQKHKEHEGSNKSKLQSQIDSRMKMKKLGSRMSSRSSSRVSSAAGSQFSSRSTSRIGSKAPSLAASRSGSRVASRSGSRIGSRAGSREPSPEPDPAKDGVFNEQDYEERAGKFNKSAMGGVDLRFKNKAWVDSGEGEDVAQREEERQVDENEMGREEKAHSDGGGEELDEDMLDMVELEMAQLLHVEQEREIMRTIARAASTKVEKVFGPRLGVPVYGLNQERVKIIADRAAMQQIPEGEEGSVEVKMNLIETANMSIVKQKINLQVEFEEQATHRAEFVLYSIEEGDEAATKAEEDKDVTRAVHTKILRARCDVDHFISRLSDTNMMKAIPGDKYGPSRFSLAKKSSLLGNQTFGCVAKVDTSVIGLAQQRLYRRTCILTSKDGKVATRRASKESRRQRTAELHQLICKMPTASMIEDQLTNITQNMEAAGLNVAQLKSEILETRETTRKILEAQLIIEERRLAELARAQTNIKAKVKQVEDLTAEYSKLKIAEEFTMNLSFNQRMSFEKKSHKKKASGLGPVKSRSVGGPDKTRGAARKQNNNVFFGFNGQTRHVVVHTRFLDGDQVIATDTSLNGGSVINSLEWDLVKNESVGDSSSGTVTIYRVFRAKRSVFGEALDSPFVADESIRVMASEIRDTLCCEGRLHDLNVEEQVTLIQRKIQMLEQNISIAYDQREDIEEKLPSMEELILDEGASAKKSLTLTKSVAASAADGHAVGELDVLIGALKVEQHQLELMKKMDGYAAWYQATNSRRVNDEGPPSSSSSPDDDRDDGDHAQERAKSKRLREVPVGVMKEKEVTREDDQNEDDLLLEYLLSLEMPNAQFAERRARILLSSADFLGSLRESSADDVATGGYPLNCGARLQQLLFKPIFPSAEHVYREQFDAEERKKQINSSEARRNKKTCQGTTLEFATNLRSLCIDSPESSEPDSSDRSSDVDGTQFTASKADMANMRLLCKPDEVLGKKTGDAGSSDGSTEVMEIDPVRMNFKSISNPDLGWEESISGDMIEPTGQVKSMRWGFVLARRPRTPQREKISTRSHRSCRVMIKGRQTGPTTGLSDPYFFSYPEGYHFIPPRFGFQSWSDHRNFHVPIRQISAVQNQYDLVPIRSQAFHKMQYSWKQLLINSMGGFPDPEAWFEESQSGSSQGSSEASDASDRGDPEQRAANFDPDQTVNEVATRLEKLLRNSDFLASRARSPTDTFYEYDLERHFLSSMIPARRPPEADLHFEPNEDSVSAASFPKDPSAGVKTATTTTGRDTAHDAASFPGDLLPSRATRRSEFVQNTAELTDRLGRRIQSGIFYSETSAPPDSPTFMREHLQPILPLRPSLNIQINSESRERLHAADRLPVPVGRIHAIAEGLESVVSADGTAVSCIDISWSPNQSARAPKPLRPKTTGEQANRERGSGGVHLARKARIQLGLPFREPNLGELTQIFSSFGFRDTSRVASRPALDEDALYSVEPSAEVESFTADINAAEIPEEAPKVPSTPPEYAPSPQIPVELPKLVLHPDILETENIRTSRQVGYRKLTEFPPLKRRPKPCLPPDIPARKVNDSSAVLPATILVTLSRKSELSLDSQDQRESKQLRARTPIIDSDPVCDVVDDNINATRYMTTTMGTADSLPVHSLNLADSSSWTMLERLPQRLSVQTMSSLEGETDAGMSQYESLHDLPRTSRVSRTSEDFFSSRPRTVKLRTTAPSRHMKSTSATVRRQQRPSNVVKEKEREDFRLVPTEKPRVSVLHMEPTIHENYDSVAKTTSWKSDLNYTENAEVLEKYLQTFDNENLVEYIGSAFVKPSFAPPPERRILPTKPTSPKPSLSESYRMRGLRLMARHEDI